MTYILITICAVLVSAFGTVVGFGGGVFMIPILVIFFHVPIKFAISSVLLALLPGSLISTLFNAKQKKIDYKGGIILEIPTILGTILGSYLTALLPTLIIEIIFALFISMVGIYNIKTAHTDNSKHKNSIFYKLNQIGPGIERNSQFGFYRMSHLLTIVFGMLAGMLAGLLGIGGGFLKTPIMVNVFNIPPFVASATALFMIIFTSATGSVSHYLLGNLYFTNALPVVIGFVLGAFIGNSINVRISEIMLRKLIGFGLLLAGVSVLIYSFFL